MAHQNHGERNFHIFYQLLEGGEEPLLKTLGLGKTNPQHYHYLVKVFMLMVSICVHDREQICLPLSGHGHCWHVCGVFVCNRHSLSVRVTVHG